MASSRYSITSNKYLSEPEFGQLQAILAKSEAKDPRNTTLIWLLVHTGARAQEALNVRPEDLNAHARTVLIHGLKGSNDRELPVPQWLFDRLVSLAETGPIFQISYKRLYQVWNEYRPCKKPVKALRHTFAQKLYNQTLDLRLVQHTLGHRSISNTMVYADHHYSQNELRKRMPDWRGPKGKKTA